jgi:hypothetical protein
VEDGRSPSDSYLKKKYSGISVEFFFKKSFVSQITTQAPTQFFDLHAIEPTGTNLFLTMHEVTDPCALLFLRNRQRLFPIFFPPISD